MKNEKFFLPKISRLVPAFLAGFVILISNFSCNPPAFVDLKEPVKAPTGIAFYEVSNQSFRNVPNVKVTIIDPEGQVLSPNGFQFNSIELHGGIMGVGLSLKAEFSSEKPYRFFVRAEAEGYMTNLKPIVITEDIGNFVPIHMAKLDSDTRAGGIATEVAMITDITNGQINTAQRLIARSTDTNQVNIALKIPEGTQLLCKGKPVKVNGPLSYRLLSGNPLDSTANLVFPGGFEVTDAVDKEGRVIERISPRTPAYFTSAGWLSMEMNIGEEAVNGFSQPVEVELAIPQGVIKGDNTPLSGGDVIPLWSLDNQTGVWKQEGETVVVEDETGRLKAAFKISHLSAWNLDYAGVTCSSNIEVTYTGSDFSGSYYTEYRRSSDNVLLKYASVNLTADGNLGVVGHQLVLQRVPDANARLFVYNGGDMTFPVRGRSSELNCTSSPNTLGRLGTASFPCVSVQFNRLVGMAETPLTCANLVWHLATCGGVPVHAGYLSSANSGRVRVQSTASGQQCLQLWYTDSAMTEILLTFRLDFGSGGTGDVWVGGVAAEPASPTTFTYTLSGAIDDCSSSITILIPNSVITGITCPL